MNTIKNIFKFQSITFLKSLITTNIAAVAIVTFMLIFGFAANSDPTFISSDPDYNVSTPFAILAVYLTAIAFASSAVLVTKCFNAFFVDLKFSLRLGTTRKNFIISNIIFFTISIIIFALLAIIYTQIMRFAFQQTIDSIEVLGNKFPFYEIMPKIFSFLFFMVGVFNILAILVFLFRWKTIGFFVAHNIFYNYVDAYTKFIDFIFWELQLSRGIVLYIVSFILVSLVIYKYNDDSN